MGNPTTMKEGTVTLTVPAVLNVPPEAGTLSSADLVRYPRGRKGLGLACEATAAAMTKKGAAFVVPGVDPAALANAGLQADTADQVVEDLRTLLAKFEQANVLIDAEAIELLRRVNGQVNAQGAFDENLFERFAAVGTYFGRK